MNKKSLIISSVIIVLIIAFISFMYIDSECDTFTTFGKCVNFEDHKNNNIKQYVTEPYGLTLEEFSYIESKVNVTDYRDIFPILNSTNGDIEKTIKILNFDHE